MLLGLMCKYSCEDCNLIIFDQFQERYIDVELDKGTILENMATVLEKNIGDVSILIKTCNVSLVTPTGKHHCNRVRLK